MNFIINTSNSEFDMDLIYEVSSKLVRMQEVRMSHTPITISGSLYIAKILSLF